MNETSKFCHSPNREGLHLHDLEPGSHFRLPGSRRTGTLKSCSEGHAVVDYDGGEIVSFNKYEGTPEEERVTFVRPERGVTIAPCTVVERMEIEEGG